MMSDPGFSSDTTELRNTLIKTDLERQRLFQSASQQLAASGVELNQQNPPTLYQKIMIQKFNAEILSRVYYPGISPPPSAPTMSIPISGHPILARRLSP